MDKQKTILVVDDDARNIFALTAVLRSNGWTVEAAGGMPEAFKKLEQNDRIGVVLLDMMMPEMDGYEALPLLKTHDRFSSLPVVAVTAQAMSGDREKCLEAGADAYLSKPVDVDALLDLLSQLP